MSKHYGDFAPLDQLPAHLINALQEMISGLGGFTVRVKPSAPTILQVPAGAGSDQVSIAINGKWRYVTASVERASPGGAARLLDVHVTAADNAFTAGSVTVGSDTFPVENDDTVHAFDLAITETGAAPGGVALSRKVAVAEWDGAKFASVGLIHGGVLEADGAIKPHAQARAAGQAIPTGALTVLDLAVVSFDTGGIVDLAAPDPTQRVTVPVSGLYLLSAAVTLPSIDSLSLLASGGSWVGLNPCAEDDSPAAGKRSVSGQIRLGAGNHVYAQVKQSSGASQSASGALTLALLSRF